LFVPQGYVLLVRQEDKPGIIAAVSNILGRESVNISFMTVRPTEMFSPSIPGLPSTTTEHPCLA